MISAEMIRSLSTRAQRRVLDGNGVRLVGLDARQRPVIEPSLPLDGFGPSAVLRSGRLAEPFEPIDPVGPAAPPFVIAVEAERRGADRRVAPRRATEAAVHYAREALVAAALAVDENAEGAINSWCVGGDPAEQFGKAVAAYRSAMAADLEGRGDR